MSVGGTEQICDRTAAIIKQTVGRTNVKMSVNNAGFNFTVSFAIVLWSVISI